MSLEEYALESVARRKLDDELERLRIGRVRLRSLGEQASQLFLAVSDYLEEATKKKTCLRRI